MARIDNTAMTTAFELTAQEQRAVAIYGHAFLYYMYPSSLVMGAALRRPSSLVKHLE